MNWPPILGISGSRTVFIAFIVTLIAPSVSNGNAEELPLPIDASIENDKYDYRVRGGAPVKHRS